MDLNNNELIYRLKRLLEEDIEQIRYGMQGDLYDLYSSIIKRELDALNKVLQQR